MLCDKYTDYITRLKDRGWLADWWTAVEPCRAKYTLFFQAILSPSPLVPIHQQYATLSIQIHLCPLTVAAVTLNAAVCQEACSVTFMVMGCKTEEIMGVWVGACARRGPEVGWMMSQAVCLVVGLCRREEPGRKGQNCRAGWWGREITRFYNSERERLYRGIWGRMEAFGALDDNKYLKTSRWKYYHVTSISFNVWTCSVML